MIWSCEICALTSRHRLPACLYGRFSTEQAAARLASNLECVSYNVLPSIGAALIQWSMGFGAAISMVAGTTYLALARPETRSSVAASQRFSQQLGGAISVAVCGYLFGALGPTWTGKPPMNRMKAAEMDGWPGWGNKLMQVLIVQER